MVSICKVKDTYPIVMLSVFTPSDIQNPATNKNLYIGSFNITEIQRGQQTFLTTKMLNLCIY